MDKKPWYLQKTVWAALGVVASGVAGIFGMPVDAITTILAGIGAIFMRNAIENAKPQ